MADAIYTIRFKCIHCGFVQNRVFPRKDFNLCNKCQKPNPAQKPKESPCNSRSSSPASTA